jgi:hypothetical protein
MLKETTAPHRQYNLWFAFLFWKIDSKLAEKAPKSVEPEREMLGWRDIAEDRIREGMVGNATARASSQVVVASGHRNSIPHAIGFASIIAIELI